MLRKLMKHEFRATGRIILPLFLLVVVTALGANLSTRTLLEVDNHFLNILGVLLMTAFVLAIIGVCMMSFVLMIHRFHTNLLQDEGYVMMTLPVSVHQQVWSKLLVSIAWFLLTGIVVCLSFVILAYDVGLVHEILQFFADLWNELWQVNSAYMMHGTAFLAEILVLMIITCIASCLQFYSAMAIGHSFSNRKVLWSVVCFFGIQFLQQLIGTLLISVLSMTGLPNVLEQLFLSLQLNESIFAASHLGLGMAILGSLLYSAIFYFLTTYFLKNRLNLG